MDFPFPIISFCYNIALLKMQVYSCMCNDRCFRYDLYDRVLQHSNTIISAF